LTTLSPKYDNNYKLCLGHKNFRRRQVMETLKSLLLDPAFTALMGALLGIIASSVNILFTWWKDYSLIKATARIEAIKVVIKELPEFFKKVIITISDINASHAEHASETRDTYINELGSDTDKITDEYKSLANDISNIVSHYMSIRHYLDKDDQIFLDDTYKKMHGLIKVAIQNKTDSNRVNAIAEFRVFCGCMYTALLKNLELQARKIGI
jgi:hypothetical protein